jgi:hypothetical protein
MNSASLCSLAGRYNDPIHARFLAHIDCLKIPALRRYNKNGDDFQRQGSILSWKVILSVDGADTIAIDQQSTYFTN